MMMTYLCSPMTSPQCPLKRVAMVAFCTQANRPRPWTFRKQQILIIRSLGKSINRQAEAPPSLRPVSLGNMHATSSYCILSNAGGAGTGAAADDALLLLVP